jgi:hypothetical protein
MIPACTPSSTWIERYEALRRHVLNAGSGLELQPLSLMLWLTQGMAGWMRRWADALQGVGSSAVIPPSRPYSTTSLWQQQLTLVLAQITVQHLYPAGNL